MPQLLLFPDPRPLVERLGAEFFRTLPECPGVYLMRGADESVLYVGKAKNLRRRLGSYRVANPDRIPRRHLRLLRAVERIDLEPCADEASALAREAEFLRTLRPKFNRAGTWPGPNRYLNWRAEPAALEIAIADSPMAEWSSAGPLGSGVFSLRAALLRLLWGALQMPRGLSQLPLGWLKPIRDGSVRIPLPGDEKEVGDELRPLFNELFNGDAKPLVEWVLRRWEGTRHPFDLAVRTEDMEVLEQFAAKVLRSGPGGKEN